MSKPELFVNIWGLGYDTDDIFNDGNNYCIYNSDRSVLIIYNPLIEIAIMRDKYDSNVLIFMNYKMLIAYLEITQLKGENL